MVKLNKTIILLTMAVVLGAADVFAQQTFVIKGRIMEKETKGPLIGASVRCGSTGAATDVDGNYELSVKEGSYDIECSYLGFENDRRRITVSCDTILDFLLQSSTSELSEVVVLSRSVMDRLKTTQPGMERIDLDEMSKTPVLFGERDILKSLQLLPGVSAEGDGAGGFQVRGGTASQNLVLLDDAPVINSGHLFGFFSTFNAPALSSATLYKGQIPARYGGATSSVFDVNTTAGNSERYKGSFTVGLLSAKFDIEVPIIKDKLSFFVSARRSYMDMFLKFTDQFKDNSLYFYDINAKVNYNIGYNDKLAVSLFVGHDNLGMSDMMNMQWGNITTTAKWYHTFNDQLASVATLYHGNFINDMGMQITSEDDNMNGHLRQTGIKYTFSWNPQENHNVDFGLQSALIDLKSAEWTMGTTHQKEQRRGWESGVWINDDWAINERVHVMGGFRLGIMSVLDYKVDVGGNITDRFTPRNGKPYKTYLSVEPHQLARRKNRVERFKHNKFTNI